MHPACAQPAKYLWGSSDAHCQHLSVLKDIEPVPSASLPDLPRPDVQPGTQCPLTCMAHQPAASSHPSLPVSSCSWLPGTLSRLAVDRQSWDRYRSLQAPCLLSLPLPLTPPPPPPPLVLAWQGEAPRAKGPVGEEADTEESCSIYWSSSCFAAS